MKNRILFLGFGLDRSRKEAVNINFRNHLSQIIDKDDEYYVFSLQPNKSILYHLLNFNKYIRQIFVLVKSKKITHVHDLFVLPMVSLFFLTLIKIKFSKVKLIKELHNNHGFSEKINLETILRFLLSSKLSIYLVLKLVNSAYSRSIYISKYWNIIYIPQYVSIRSLSRKLNLSKRNINICYLGHPLSKKGIYIFPKLVSSLKSTHDVNFNYNFAFSDIGDKSTIISLLSDVAAKNKIKVTFVSRVVASTFFRRNDIFILPLIDEYSATSVPNTILEAMEAGCIVITTKNRINSYVIQNNFNGIILEENNLTTLINTINSLILSKKAYSQISIEARKYIETNHKLSYIKSCFKNMYYE